MRHALTAAVIAAASLLCLPAAAQQLWIEQQGGDAKMYFGDFAANRRETSPGALDTLPSVQAQVVALDSDAWLTPKKLGNGFDLGVRAVRGQVVYAQETGFPLLETQEGDRTVRTAWIPAARFVPDMGPQEPVLALDVFPSRSSGQYRVTYLNKPLPEAKVVVVSPSGWRRDVTTDAEGMFRVELPWKGPWAIEVQHTDDTPGQKPGPQGLEKYDVVEFVTTLTFDFPSGPKPPAPLPPARPH